MKTTGSKYVLDQKPCCPLQPTLVHMWSLGQSCPRKVAGKHETSNTQSKKEFTSDTSLPNWSVIGSSGGCIQLPLSSQARSHSAVQTPYPQGEKT